MPSTQFKVAHKSLVRYRAGKNVFEEKPLVYTNIGQTWKYEITFSEHSTYYDFYNSEKLIDDFLSDVKNRVTRSSQGDFIIKWGFSCSTVSFWK